MLVLQTEAVIRRLNSTARLLQCEGCRVGLSEVLGTGRYDTTAAAAHADWQQVAVTLCRYHAVLSKSAPEMQQGNDRSANVWRWKRHHLYA
jgi:G3E family GTPase